ncbi:hypothetical protein [Mycobacterium sp. Marseille-P9652]|uniref:hypothetical protein n=1 Tax=Mycobacterium sp. Marseille-P9652 TaxID=2654950 RepID=UPI0012E93831|nr:hypothetical protein [Mycobacterium sp. Marseille-P9652]
MITMKFVATSLAAAGVVGATAFGLTAVAAVPAGDQAGVRLAAVGAPLPQDPAPAPAAAVPSADQLNGVLTSLADPSVPFANKSNLVEGGISGMTAHVADKKLKKAAEAGDLPLAFNVTNIQPAAAGSATADVAVSGPKIPSPVTQNVTFVNQGGWMLSRASAMELLQAVGQ